MTDPKVTLHDVSVAGATDHDSVLRAIEAAVMAAAQGNRSPSPDAVKAAITTSVSHATAGGAE